MKNAFAFRVSTPVRQTHNGVVLRLWPHKEDADKIAKRESGESVLHVSQNGWFVRDANGRCQDAFGVLRQDPNEGPSDS